MLVCHCHAVNDTRIAQVLAAGADGVRGVVRATSAGTGCGSCLPALRRICVQAADEQRRCELAYRSGEDEQLAG